MLTALSHLNRLWIFIALGLFFSTIFVALWVPEGMWVLPIQNEDAPAHYAIIQRFLDYGVNIFLHASPDEKFYPPLFHFIAASIIWFLGLFGLHISIFTGFTITWIIGAGIILPFGICLLVKQFSMSFKMSPNMPNWIFVFVPLFSVFFAAFPYNILAQGPLIAYGFAVSFLPLLIYCTLTAINTFANFMQTRREKITRLRTKNKRLITDLIFLIAVVLVEALSQPRIFFAALVILFPFVITFLLQYKKLLIAFLATIIIGAIAFVFTAIEQYGEKLGDPTKWFKSHKLTKTPFEAIVTVLSGGISGGDDGTLLSVIIPLLACIFGAIALLNIFILSRKLIPLAIAYILCSLLYILTVSFDGAIPNILTAPFYRDESRLISPLSILYTLLIVTFVLQMIMRAKKHASRTILSASYVLSIVIFLLPFSSTNLWHTRDMVNISTQINDQSRLTPSKMHMFDLVEDSTESDSLIIADPINGSEYYYQLTGRHTLYNTMNPRWAIGDPWHMGITAFTLDSPNDTQVMLCRIDVGTPKYFLDLGSRHPTGFPYAFQFDGMQDHEKITKLVETDAFTKVLSNNEFALYRVNC